METKTRLHVVGGQIAAASIVLLAAAGCESEPERPVDMDAAIAMWEPEVRGVGFDAALIEGTLAVIDGCVGVEMDGQAVIPIFPTQVDTWSSAREGDAVSMGGSFLGSWERSTVDPEIPPECDALDAGYFLVSPDT